MTNTYTQRVSMWQVRVDAGSSAPHVEVKRHLVAATGHLLYVRDCTGIIDPADAARAVLRERPDEEGWRCAPFDAAERWDDLLWKEEERRLSALAGEQS